MGRVWQGYYVCYKVEKFSYTCYKVQIFYYTSFLPGAGLLKILIKTLKKPTPP